jgi:caa(3)-type oxidase subunit IV
MTEITQTTDNAHITPAEHSHSDTVTLPILGTITVMGGIYTVVFGGLAILTALEVLIAELTKFWEIRTVPIIALMGIAIAKAALVVMYYMHLRTDSRLFALALLLPLGIVTLCLIYLMGVPTGGGLGYLPPR